LRRFLDDVGRFCDFASSFDTRQYCSSTMFDEVIVNVAVDLDVCLKLFGIDKLFVLFKCFQ